MATTNASAKRRSMAFSRRVSLRGSGEDVGTEESHGSVARMDCVGPFVYTLAMRNAALLFFVAFVAGCRTVPDAVDMKPEEAYQRIANELPRADFGWGPPSGLAELAASSRRDRPPESEPVDISCDERSMKVAVEVFRTRTFAIPYASIEDVSYSYSLFPNLLFCVAFPFLQLSETCVVFDAGKVP